MRRLRKQTVGLAAMRNKELIYTIAILVLATIMYFLERSDSDED